MTASQERVRDKFTNFRDPYVGRRKTHSEELQWSGVRQQELWGNEFNVHN